jgi:galactose mutarotase-like enzyme
MYDSDYIKNGNAKVGFNPQGGYVTSWKVDTTDIFYIGSTIKRTGIPILFPYYGKARSTRMHGFGRDSLWRIVEKENSHCVLELSNVDLSEDAKKEYPFQFNTQLSLSLPQPNQLEYALTVLNKSETALPLSPGIHPYWKTSHTNKKNIRITGVEGFSADTIDWDNAPPDDSLPFNQPVKISLETHSIQIEETSDPKQAKYIQVWSQTPLRDPDYNFICVEPICGLNYGINDSPILVAPNDAWTMKITFSQLP